MTSFLGPPERHNHVTLRPSDIMLKSYDVGGCPPGRHNHVPLGPYDIMLTSYDVAPPPDTIIMSYDIMLKSYDMTYDVGGSLHNVICHVI